VIEGPPGFSTRGAVGGSRQLFFFPAVEGRGRLGWKKKKKNRGPGFPETCPEGRGTFAISGKTAVGASSLYGDLSEAKEAIEEAFQTGLRPFRGPFCSSGHGAVPEHSDILVDYQRPLSGTCSSTKVSGNTKPGLAYLLAVGTLLAGPAANDEAANLCCVRRTTTVDLRLGRGAEVDKHFLRFFRGTGTSPGARRESGSSANYRFDRGHPGDPPPI